MAEITHFTHEHPLILRKGFPKYNVDGYGNFCYLCDPVSSQAGVENEREYADAYVCETCKKFFLHKSCAELPKEIIHKSHEIHPLVLSNKSAYNNSPCSDCREDIINMSYKCYICEFPSTSLHIRCAFKENNSVIHYGDNDCTMIHASHKEHSMRLFPRPASVLCDACDVYKQDFFYHCLSCIYQIHRSCALLQSTSNGEDHPHPLTLSFGLPSVYHSLDFNCEGCIEKIDKGEKIWLYYCKLCRYFVHIKCMRSSDPRKLHAPSLNGYYDDYYLLSSHLLPTPDKSKDLIQRFLLGNKDVVDIPQEIQMFSHKHPLRLSNEQITEDVIEDDEEILCDGCIEPISSSPYYHCAQCRYFLHLPCANLPSNFRDPYAPTLLTLGSKSRFYEDFTCYKCSKISNGFYFGCGYKGNQVYLDVKCAAFLSSNRYVIKHESHHHPLFQDHSKEGKYKDLPENYKCKACNVSIQERVDNPFTCPFCPFNYHYDCLMLPKTTRHRFDYKHPLILKFPPHDYHDWPFDCAACEKEIHPCFWLYHCEECDLSFHLKCINPTIGRMKFGQELQINTHSHPLKFVMEASVKSACHQCGVDIHLDVAFECETCNFHLCRKCVKNIELKS